MLVYWRLKLCFNKLFCSEGKKKKYYNIHMLSYERLMLNDETRDSWPLEEMNSIRGQRRVWVAQSFCVIRFY